MIRTFYVRPQAAEGYGKGDGSSYENAWNGFQSVNWEALAGQPATLWVCGEPGGPGGFVTLHVEWSYLQAGNEMRRPEIQVASENKTRTDTRREPALAV
jgi:hypothetical protein